ncbi:MAG: class I SAM-dependent methyltransferase, partial [Jatrophihabitans sp.]
MTGPVRAAAYLRSPALPRPVTPVGVLAARLHLLVEDIERTHDIGSALLAELQDLADLAGGLEPYTNRCTSPESADLARLVQATQAHDWGGPDVPVEQEMLSGQVEGRFLAMLVQVMGATRVLDIGMFTGYSALAMAEALPYDGLVIGCELDAGVAAFAQAGFDASRNGHKISVRVGPAGATLHDLAEAGEIFDLVFLDADKAGYLAYLSILLEGGPSGRGLLAPGGLICADNTLLQGEPYRPRRANANGTAIARFNEAVAADDRVEQV